MILATKALLDRSASPSEDEIRDALSGVLDRESGYVKVVAAVQLAAARLRGDDPPPGATPRGRARPPTRRRHVRSSASRQQQGRRGPARQGRSPSSPTTSSCAGLLHAKLLRSPHAHARIVAIDDTRARALPGVHAVLHYANTPRVKYASGGQTWPNPYPWDQVSFDDKVRHVGDRVAAVAAETRGDRRGGLPRGSRSRTRCCRRCSTSSRRAAPARRSSTTRATATGSTTPRRNIAPHVEGATVAGHRRGVRAAPSTCSSRPSASSSVSACPIEPHVTIGWLDEDERLVLRRSTQVPFHVRRMVAPLLGLPVKRIRVIKPRDRRRVRRRSRRC